MKVLASVFFVLFLMAADAEAQSCVVSFNDSFGLSLLDPSMAYGFMAPGGGLIWYYNQCGSGSDNWLYFDEDPNGGFPVGTEYDHFHIPFVDPTVNCFTTTSAYPGGVMGWQSFSGCVVIDPYIGPRTLLPHAADGVLRIRYLADTGEPLRYIQLDGIRVLGQTPVSVLVQAANGSWWVWSDLPAGDWILTGALPARRAFVFSNATSLPRWQIGGLGISLGDYYTVSAVAVCILCPQYQFRAVRDFLSRITLRAGTNSRTTTSAAVPGGDGSLPAAIYNAKSGRAVSEGEALRLLQRPQRETHDHDENLDEILQKILGADGTERQVLIMEYMLAASKLPVSRHAAAQRRLVALFESKR